ncbi:MAG: Bax inhibitor-1/YccA family protein [Candidatus Acidiferrales bacterium]
MANLMRTSNPALNPKAFQGEGVAVGEAMTLRGTVNKTGFLLICVMATAIWTWNLFMESHNPESVMGLAMIGGIGGFIFALLAIFKKTWAPVTAPIYALLEGLVLGGVSAMFEMRYNGIAIQAVSLTFGTLVVLLLAYRSGLIPVTQKFKLGVVAATGGIALFYIVSMVLGFFGVHFAVINGNGTLAIAFSAFVVVIAALNLVLDFDFIENAVSAGVPKYMEWYAAFGLMVTLIWLYFEILRLLSKLRERN